MAGLPIVLNSSKYEVELPLSKKKVEYRPYLVKEEKQLMLAMESQDPVTIMKTVQDIIEACTFGEVKAKTLPTAELELLFLKLRSKSVGETSKIGYKCTNCGQTNELEVNLEEVTIDLGDKKISNKVMVTDKVGVILKYPTSDDITRIMGNGDKTDVKNIFALIVSCIETIFDEENTYDARNIEKKDMEAFIDSLNSKQFERIKDFFESIPKLRKDVSFDCDKCGTHNDLVLEGLQNFFA
jgi:DNA-directed RNA polymerase subunit M/transcription elongation factor TFIIS